MSATLASAIGARVEVFMFWLLCPYPGIWLMCRPPMISIAYSVSVWDKTFP